MVFVAGSALKVLLFRVPEELQAVEIMGMGQRQMESSGVTQGCPVRSWRWTDRTVWGSGAAPKGPHGAVSARLSHALTDWPLGPESPGSRAARPGAGAPRTSEKVPFKSTSRVSAEGRQELARK